MNTELDEVDEVDDVLSVCTFSLNRTSLSNEY